MRHWRMHLRSVISDNTVNCTNVPSFFLFSTGMLRLVYWAHVSMYIRITQSQDVDYGRLHTICVVSSHSSWWMNAGVTLNNSNRLPMFTPHKVALIFVLQKWVPLNTQRICTTWYILLLFMFTISMAFSKWNITYPKSKVSADIFRLYIPITQSK